MKHCIRRSCHIPILALMVFLCILSSEASAQYFQLRLVSSAYAWQRQDTVSQSSHHLFGYQTAQLSLSKDNVSLHTYLQGFNDFSGPLKNKGTLRFYDLYIKYSNFLDMIDVSFGRQMIFAGVGNGTIDGGLLSARFFDSRLKLIGYYGALPVANGKLTMVDDQSHNNMLGAQIVGSPASYAKLSFSYMRKLIKPETYWMTRASDSLGTVHSVEISPTAESEQYLSGDVNIDYDIVSAYARTDADLNLEKISRVQLFTRVKVMEPLALTGEYIHREPRLSYNSIFWVFTYNAISEYEVGAEYTILKDWQVFGRFGNVSYGDEKSNRVTLGGNMKYASASFSWNTGYAGELTALSANAGYPLFNNTLTPTIMAGYASYKLSEDAPQSNAMNLGVGAVYRPFPLLSLDMQVQWLRNNVYNNDVRLFLRASYSLSDQLNLF
jgi:hypothetical protein